MKSLLNFTKKINMILDEKQNSEITLKNICNELSDNFDLGVILVDLSGKIISSTDDNFSDIIVGHDKENYINENLNSQICRISAPLENIFLCQLDITSSNKDLIINVVPINIGGEKICTAIFCKNNDTFTESDLIALEIFIIISSVILSQLITEKEADIQRNKNIVKASIATFSYSELEAMLYLFKELDGWEGIIIASKLAKEVGITRSVIVNAIRKFESAGIIESHSLGMKGTYVKTINKYLPEELDLVKKNFVNFR